MGGEVNPVKIQTDPLPLPWAHLQRLLNRRFPL
jgi:hypothetical protein